MSHVRVKSGTIFSVKYNPETQELAVRYVCPRCKGSNSGEFNCKQCSGFGFDGEYTFKAVPAEVHKELMDNESTIGKTFLALIKKGGYSFVRSE